MPSGVANPVRLRGPAVARFTMISVFTMDITQVATDGALAEVGARSDAALQRIISE
jgi:hypothetical protein